jgi:hypothetical protein
MMPGNKEFLENAWQGGKPERLPPFRKVLRMGKRRKTLGIEIRMLL